MFHESSCALERVSIERLDGLQFATPGHDGSTKTRHRNNLLIIL